MGLQAHHLRLRGLGVDFQHRVRGVDLDHDALLVTVALTLVVFERAGGWSPGLARGVHVLTGITFVVAAAAVGKLLGVTRARRTLNRYAATLSRSAASD